METEEKVLLEANIAIRRSPDEVWAYLAEVNNVAHWDRGVASTEVTSAAPPGIGFEFDTLARSSRTAEEKDWGRMSYRITDVDRDRGCTIQLTSKTGNARYFRQAEWRFHVEAEGQGSRVFCAADFRLRFPWQILAPVLFFMKGAILRDLESLRQRLESGTAAGAPAAKQTVARP
ncbi:MAG: SRPBCC family protein [Acidobacteriaceae bacterium]